MALFVREEMNMISIYERDRVPAILAIGKALSTDYGKAMFLAIYEEEEENAERRERASEFCGRRLSKEKVSRDADVTWSSGVKSGLWNAFVAYIALTNNLYKVQADHELYYEFCEFKRNATEEQVEAMRDACKTSLKVRYR